MSLKKVHAIVTGRVQGVFFRKYTQEQADKLKLAGWVRNLPDGSVETVFQGEKKTVEQMLAWLYKGSPHSQVTGVLSNEEKPADEFTEFTIRY